MAQEQLEGLLDRNTKSSESWHPMPTIDQMYEMMKSQPPKTGATIIVTCADPRADPAHYLGLNPGEMVVIRNAGGRVTEDVLSSLELIGCVMPISLLIVIHHTECGGLYMTEKGIRDQLSAREPQHADSIKDKNWHTFSDIGIDQSVRDDVSAMKKWHFLQKGTLIAGYVFDIASGKLREIVQGESS